MILHTFNHPDTYQRFHSLVCNTDQVVLLEDAVYCEVATPAAHHAVTDDLQRRGASLPDKANAISYDEYVQLCCDADKVISW